MMTTLFRTTTLALFALLVSLPFAGAGSANPDWMPAGATVTTDNPAPSATCTELMQGNMVTAAVQIELGRYTPGDYTYGHVMIEGAANVFDWRTGSVTRQIEPGFNLVIATDTE